MPGDNIRQTLLDIFNLLYKIYGPRKWWPADSDFEVCVGAILTQNTSWANVEKAILNLKSKNALNPSYLYRMTPKDLARFIRPCGYYNIKTERLKGFLSYLFSRHNGEVKRMRPYPVSVLRRGLLGVKGIGHETADSIILYAVKKPIFVVDAYTRRIMGCQGLIGSGAAYDDIQSLFMENLPKNVRLFNEYHAILVEHGKKVCRPKPNCKECVLHSLKAPAKRKG